MPQKNIQPSIDDDTYKYFGIKDTPLQKLYLELEARIALSIDMIKAKHYNNYTKMSCSLKISALVEALLLLKRALFIKENIGDYIHLENTQENDVNLLKLLCIEFFSIDNLLDFNVSLWSDAHGDFIEKENLRQSLNISRTLSGLTGCTFTFFNTLWGKSDALECFEKGLSESTHFDSDAYKKSKDVHAWSNEYLKRDDVVYKSMQPTIPTRESYQKNGPM